MIRKLLENFALVIGAGYLMGADAPAPWPPTPEPWHNVEAQKPGFGVLLSPGVAPCVIHVNGLRFPLATGTPITTRYDWDFGDPNSRYNHLPGFNAAHVYDQPGQYTIKLTVTDEAQTVQSATATVIIAPNHRHDIFVSPDGSDLNVGTGPESPLHSLGKACKILRDGTQILLKAGGTYDVNSMQSINHSDVLIGRYDDGADPIIMLSKQDGPKAPSGNFSLDKRCNGVMFEHLTFDSPYGVADDAPAPKIGIEAISARGRNITVRDCTFLNVDNAVNGNGFPTGLLVEKCNAPLKTGLRAYMVWGQGTDLVCLGNTVANSTREHNMRLFSEDRSLVFDNNLSNLDRRPADKDDFSKGCIEMQRGSYGYIAHNITNHGTIRTGPLGMYEDDATASNWAVIEDNQVNDSWIVANPGAHHVMIRNNTIRNSRFPAIELKAPDGHGRNVADVHVLNNTAINTGEVGSFLNVWGHVNGIELRNNVFIAPHLQLGKEHTAAIFAMEKNAVSFVKSENNTWPTMGNADRGFAILGSTVVTPKDWAALPQVTNDRAADVAVPDSKKSDHNN